VVWKKVALTIGELVRDFFAMVGVLKKGVELLLVDESEGARGKELWLERCPKRVVI
jgi:hypothetical protein